MSKLKFLLKTEVDNNFISDDALLVVSQSDLRELVDELCATSQVKPIKEEDRLLTREETKAMLKVCYSTLWGWNINGTLKSVKIGRKVYYRESDINKILLNN